MVLHQLLKLWLIKQRRLGLVINVLRTSLAFEEPSMMIGQRRLIFIPVQWQGQKSKYNKVNIINKKNQQTAGFLSG
jgi:hypothetical protein